MKQYRANIFIDHHKDTIIVDYIDCLRVHRSGLMPAHLVNWILGQKAFGCATATLKAGKAEANGGYK
eukprot:1132406-Pleurochrysis_carterae.AAC.1